MAAGMKPAIKTGIGLLLTAAVFAADQLSKYAVKAFMEARNGAPLDLISGFCTIVHSTNTGVAFGMFSNAPVMVLYVPVLIIVGLLIYMMKTGGGGSFRYFGMISVIGGALGNLLDRIRFGKVYDFIDIYVGAYHWPAFNAADSFIVIGIFLFAIAMLRGEFDEL